MAAEVDDSSRDGCIRLEHEKAEVAVERDHQALFSMRTLENRKVGFSGLHVCNVMARLAQPDSAGERNILIYEEACHAAGERIGRIVSSWRISAAYANTALKESGVSEG
jgi:hypothetical protein